MPDRHRAVNQLPESDQGGIPGIKELLTQLQRVIDGNDELPPQEKAEALKQVKVLAEAGKNPQEEEKRSLYGPDRAERTHRQQGRF